MKKLMLALAIIIIVAGCSSTKLVSSWVDPDATGSELEKVMVVVMSPNELRRRSAEDMIAAESDRLEPSYKYFTKELIEKNDEAATKMILEKEGFDGTMVLKLIEKSEEQTYVQGTNYRPVYGYGYGGYWGYHSAYWGGYYDPGYYRTDKNYFIETSIFSLTEDKLLWSGITKTVNPSKLDKTINEISFVTVRRMKKDGFIKD